VKEPACLTLAHWQRQSLLPLRCCCPQDVPEEVLVWMVYLMRDRLSSLYCML
jgi:hypothetical protein